MRIGIVVESFPVLSETFISNKVKYLQQSGHKIFIFCNRKNDELFKKLFDKQSSIQVIILSRKNFIKYFFINPVLIFQLNEWKFLKKNLFSKYKVNVINKYKCDIIHFEFSGIAVSYLNYFEKLKGKTIVSCRGTAENVNLSLYPSRQKDIIILFSKVNAIHCVSEALKKVIFPYCDQPKKIFINEPGIDTKLFINKKNIHNNPAVILSIGRFIFQKGYLTGMLAIKKLKEYTTDFKWIIAGGGTQFEELFFYVTQMNLQDNVVLLGKKNADEIMLLYQHADIFFLPSVTEGIANVALEAMSMCLPVVATKSGGMAEVIENGVSGLLSEVYDEDALAANLKFLLTEETFRKKIASAGEQKAKAGFDIDIRITKFEEVYNNLLSQ